MLSLFWRAFKCGHQFYNSAMIFVAPFSYFLVKLNQGKQRNFLCSHTILLWFWKFSISSSLLFLQEKLKFSVPIHKFYFTSWVKNSDRPQVQFRIRVINVWKVSILAAYRQRDWNINVFSTKEIYCFFLFYLCFFGSFSQLVKLFILVFLFLNRVSFLDFLTLLIVTSIEYKVASVIIHFSFERGFP